MKIRFLFVLFLSFGLISCQFLSSKKEKETVKKIDSVKNSKRITSAPSKLLNAEANEELKSWIQYQKVTKLIKEYYDVSVLEALQNATELATEVQKLKDSVKIDKLKIVTVQARLNVFHNEALRLQDMSEIPSITDEEVSEKVKKILELYSSLNEKINSIYNVEKYDINDIN